AHGQVGGGGELGAVLLGVADLVVAAAGHAEVHERAELVLRVGGRGDGGVVERGLADLVVGDRARRGDGVLVPPGAQRAGVRGAAERGRAAFGVRHGGGWDRGGGRGDQEAGYQGCGA